MNVSLNEADVKKKEKKSRYGSGEVKGGKSMIYKGELPEEKGPHMQQIKVRKVEDKERIAIFRPGENDLGEIGKVLGVIQQLIPFLFVFVRSLFFFILRICQLAKL
jgi:hypothetical protein